MKKIILSLASLFFALAFSGCALISQPRTQTVFIDSTPTDANVYQNGVLVGTTPITLTYDKQRAPTVVVEKEGFATTQIKIRRGLNPVGKLDAVFSWTLVPFLDLCSFGRALEYKESAVVVPMRTEEQFREQILQAQNMKIKNRRADGGIWLSPYVLICPYRKQI